MCECVRVCVRYNFTEFYRCYSTVWIFETDGNVQICARPAPGLGGALSLLTHLLEDISTAADLAQQLLVGDGQVVVGRVPFPEKDKKGNHKSVAAQVFSLALQLWHMNNSVSAIFVRTVEEIYFSSLTGLTVYCFNALDETHLHQSPKPSDTFTH